MELPAAQPMRSGFPLLVWNLWARHCTNQSPSFATILHVTISICCRRPDLLKAPVSCCHFLRNLRPGLLKEWWWNIFSSHLSTNLKCKQVSTKSWSSWPQNPPAFRTSAANSMEAQVLCLLLWAPNIPVAMMIKHLRKGVTHQTKFPSAQHWIW